MNINDQNVEIKTDLENQLHELLEHNHEMLKDAQEGQWDKVIEAEVLRNTLLKNLYSVEGISDTPGIRRATNTMLTINQQLEQLATAAKQSAANDTLTINKGRNAVNAYTQQGR